MVSEPIADQVDEQQMAWLARSFGRPDYSPLSTQDFESLVGVAEVVAKYPGAHLFREGEEASAVYLVESGLIEVYRGEGSVRRVVGIGQNAPWLLRIAYGLQRVWRPLGRQTLDAFHGSAVC